MSEELSAIEVDYDLDEPIEKVWRALTDASLISDWLMKCDFKAEVGHKFTFTAQPIPGHWDGKVDCEVLAIEPRRLVRYSWRGGKKDASETKFTLDTVVTWTLEPTANGGTRLHLSHTGFTPANAFSFDAMGKGWRTHVADRMRSTISGKKAEEDAEENRRDAEGQADRAVHS